MPAPGYPTHLPSSATGATLHPQESWIQKPHCLVPHRPFPGQVHTQGEVRLSCHHSGPWFLRNRRIRRWTPPWTLKGPCALSPVALV